MKKSILILLTSPLCLFSMTGKPEAVSGHYDYSVDGSTEVLKVHDKTILEYQKFNIEKHETTRYEQPSSSSTLLCRVKGGNPSKIRGKLEANGKLLFINPHGIIFSETAQVNVGTLIASTLDIQNDHFLTDKFKFELASGSHESSIVNKGKIEAAHNVVFMAPKIINQGVISAKAGKIVLMGGEKITLDFDGDQMIQFVVDEPLKNGFIQQAGELNAAHVFMKLPMAQHAIRSVLNANGIVEAGHIEIENGVIWLKAGSSTNCKKLQVEGEAIEIKTPVSAGSVYLTARHPIKIDHPITAVSGDLVVDAPLHFITPKVTLEALHGKLMHFEGVLKGNVDLSLNAPDGEIVLKENLGDLKNKLKKVTINGRKIYQHGDVISTGPIQYTAEQIYLGRDLISDNTIILDGAVTLFKNDAINIKSSTYKAGNITFKSTLDANAPNQILNIKNGTNNVEIHGAIGKQGPLGELVIHSDKVTFHNDIGGDNPGIIQALIVKSSNNSKIELKGSLYFTGEQSWETGGICLTHKGPVELITSGGHLSFGKNASIYLDKTTSFSINTHGGVLNLAGIVTGDHLQNIIIQTENGDATLNKIELMDFRGRKPDLQVKGNTIILENPISVEKVFMEASDTIKNGDSAPSLKASDSIKLIARGGSVDLMGTVEANQIEIEAGADIQNGGPLIASDKVSLNSKEGSVIIKNRVHAKHIQVKARINIENEFGVLPSEPSSSNEFGGHNSGMLEAGAKFVDSSRVLKAVESITLNAVNGSVGGPQDQQSILIDTGAILYVNSKQISYLKGNCANQYPYAYSSNVPPSIFLNGKQLNPFVPPERFAENSQTADDVLIKTLSPDLLYKISTGFMDGSVIKPRKAPIYYETSSK